MDTSINTTQIPWGPIGEEVYRRSYARPKPDGSKETWPETVRRVVAGTSDRVPVSDVERETLIREIEAMRVLPAGRHLWMSGTGLPYTRNCWRAPWSDRLADHFEFSSAQLLTGGGVGANYSSEYVKLSPTIVATKALVTCSPTHPEYESVRAAAGDHWLPDGIVTLDPVHVMKDTREDWTEAWGLLFDAATGLRPPKVIIDVTALRPFGTPVKTFGGTASGPVPFVRAVVGIWSVLDEAVGRHMRPVEAMLADHYIAAAVVSGGVRRSARMSILHWKDPDIIEFIECKTNPEHHWTTNISVEVDDEFFAALDAGDWWATLVFDATITGMYLNGEPGFYNSALAHEGETGDVRSTNPCGEVTLEEFESCNIGSVNLAAYGTDASAAIEGFRLMTRFLLRSTLNPPTDERSAEVEARNRRIGVGFLGLQEWAAAYGVVYSEIPNSQMLGTLLQVFRTVVREEADQYAIELGIPSPIKVTAVAPNGTIAQLPGVKPGAHATPARYFIRRVQYTWGDPGILLAHQNGLHVEDSVYAANTAVVSYPVRDSILDAYPEHLVEQADEVSIDKQLAVLAFVTENFCSGSDGNGVSFTAGFDPAHVSMDDLAGAVRRWLPSVKGITAFPALSRPQLPYEAITREQFELLAAGVSLADQRGDSNSGECRGAACPIR